MESFVFIFKSGHGASWLKAIVFYTHMVSFTSLASQQHYEASTKVFPILQMKKMKFRKEDPASHPRARSWWWDWDSTLGVWLWNLCLYRACTLPHCLLTSGVTKLSCILLHITWPCTTFLFLPQTPVSQGIALSRCRGPDLGIIFGFSFAVTHWSICPI